MTAPQDENPPAVADEDEAPAVTPEELEKRLKALEEAVGKLDPRITKRINDLNTAVANNKSELTKKIGTVESDLGTVKTKADNNAESIGSFQGQLDTLTHKVGDAETATTLLKQRLDNSENWQSAFNTAFVNGIQSAKDFAKEQGDAAKKHADDAVAVVDAKVDNVSQTMGDRITAVENAPVKQHTHKLHFSVDGETGGPGGGNA